MSASGRNRAAAPDRGAGEGRRGRRRAGPSVGIVGSGRAGLALALALLKARVPVLGVHGRRDKPVPSGVALTFGPLPPWLGEADVVILAVADDALAALAERLAATGVLRIGQVWLHLSGALTAEVLSPLAERGVACGSMHPLMSVAEEPELAAKRFRGATFALEGEFEAVRVADGLVRALGGCPAMIPPEGKVLYHAGAVFASNYLVTALAVAERLMERAGMGREAARAALQPLALATVAGVAAAGPQAALTGPVARGDAATVRRHRACLGPEERRLYDALARATLAIAREKGLPSSAEAAVLAALGEAGGPADRRTMRQ